MNWLTKAIKFGEKIKKVFRKRPSKEEIENSDWTSCCKGPVLKKDLEENLWVCNSCGKHHRISCRQRFDIFFGKNQYQILESPIPAEDPLDWVDTKTYKERLKVARKKTNQNSAVMIAKGRVNGIEITAGAINFDFIGGSVGAAEGEAIIYGVQHAIDNQTPFIMYCASGGQRMMESAIALQQMSRTVLAVNELKKNNLPYIVVLTNPTTGGVIASFAMLGDIIVAEPKATIGFSGRRVIEQTIGETLPEGFQTSEYVLDHGGIDLVVSRKDIRDTIINLITILLKKNETRVVEASNENQEDNKQIASFAS